MTMQFEVTYSVLYQKKDDPTWWCFTGRVFDNPVGRMHNETHDRERALKVAQQLYDGEIHTDSRPRYRDFVTATRVMQHIYGGGTVYTYGTPHPDSKED